MLNELSRVSRPAQHVLGQLRHGVRPWGRLRTFPGHEKQVDIGLTIAITAGGRPEKPGSGQER